MATKFSFQVKATARKGELAAMIAAHLMCERMIAARVFLVHVLSVIGLLLWLEAVWPWGFSDHMRVVTWALWGTCSLATLGAAALEWAWRCIRQRRLTAYASPEKGKEA